MIQNSKVYQSNTKDEIARRIRPKWAKWDQVDPNDIKLDLDFSEKNFSSTFLDPSSIQEINIKLW